MGTLVYAPDSATANNALLVKATMLDYLEVEVHLAGSARMFAGCGQAGSVRIAAVTARVAPIVWP